MRQSNASLKIILLRKAIQGCCHHHLLYKVIVEVITAASHLAGFPAFLSSELITEPLQFQLVLSPVITHLEAEFEVHFGINECLDLFTCGSA